MSILADQAQRQEALDITQSFIVQAPAGSGKTELLTQRYLALLASAKIPEEIIAITFTRKAAAEMRTRVIEILSAANNNLVEEIPAHKLQSWQLAQAVLKQNNLAHWNLLDNPNRLRIQTIDSLSAQITRQMPILSRFGTQPNITDDAYLLYKLAAREILTSLENDMPWTPHLVTLLIHLDNDFSKVEKLLIDMLAKRDQWLPYVITHAQENDLRNILENSLQTAIQDSVCKLTQCIPHVLITELFELLNFASSQLAFTNPDSIIVKNFNANNKTINLETGLAFAELLLTKDGQWRKSVRASEGFPAPSAAKDKTEKGLLLNFKKRMEALLEELNTQDNFYQALLDLQALPPHTYNVSQWKILTALLNLLPIAVAQLQLIFREQAAVDHIEIAQSALAALGDPQSPTDLALALDYQIKHLLIDEFQDTSISQLRFLEQLTAGWQPDDGRTLFLVGDPMQSIYRFRKTEVGLFLKLRQQGIGSIKLKPLTLQVNFRSTATLIEWTNNTFQTLLPKQEDITTGAVSFSPSFAGNTELVESKVTTHWLPNTNNSGSEAQIVTNIVQTSLTKNPQGTIAILVRARSHLMNIVTALQNANIPYRAVEIETLHDRPIILDLLALTRALLHPADRIAWLAILRAPWCGLTLNDLHALSSCNFQKTILECLEHSHKFKLTTDGKQRLKKITPILFESIKQRRRQPLARWIKGVWIALGGPACLANANELNDVTNYFNLLEKLAIGNDVIELKRLEDSLFSLYATPNNGHDIKVDVMTIHKAKGLEFDTVILPGLGRSLPIDEQQLLLFMERPTLTGDSHLLFAPIKASTEELDSIYNFLRREEQKKADYEITRLLYVAATRAKQFLHLVGTVKPDIKTNSYKPAGNSLLERLWLTVGNINSITTNNNSGAETQIDNTGNIVLKRLLSAWELPTVPEKKAPAFKTLRFTEAFTFPTSNLFTHHSFFQESEIIHFIGNIIYLLLQQISQKGLAKWQQENNYRNYCLYLLKQHGIKSDELEKYFNTIKNYLDNIVADDLASWIFDNSYAHHASRYALTILINEKITNLKIDKTFIDNNQTRWLINFKSDYTNDNLDIFFTEKNMLYFETLEQCAHALQKTENNKIKLGLYYPLLNHWFEKEYASNV